MTPIARGSQPAYVELGIAFGVRTAEGLIKSNIKDYFLLSKILYLKDLEAGILQAPNKSKDSYKISVDKRLKNLIYLKGKAPAIISFQKRIDGNFAVARLFEAKRSSNPVTLIP